MEPTQITEGSDCEITIPWKNNYCSLGYDVHVVDRVVSGNLAELDDWLRTVAFVASHVAHDDEGQYIPDITELDNWLEMDSEKAVTPI